MSIKLFVTSLVVCVTCLVMSAHDSLIIKTQDGASNTIKFEDLTRINFIDGALQLEFAGQEPMEVNFDDLAAIHFGSTVSVSEIVPDENAQVEIYSVNGMFMGRFDASELHSLPSGIYIVKQGNHISKIIK